MDLDHLSNHFYPHKAAAWGQERKLRVYFVDNEWVRVEVDREALRDFVNVLQLTHDEGRRVTGIEETPDRLVIEAEAF